MKSPKVSPLTLNEEGDWQIDSCVMLMCLRCELIGGPGVVDMRPSYTMYHWDGKGEDPNRDLPLCESCARYHYEEMKERWMEAGYNL